MPQHFVSPSSVSPQLWFQPLLITMNFMSAGSEDTLYSLNPQHTTMPLPWIPHVWNTPLLISVKRLSSGGVACP